MISEGRVTVNSEIIKNMGMTIDPEIDNVAVDGKPIGILPIKWVKVNKPKGFLTTAKDDRGRPVLYDLLPNDMRSLRYVGRLDYLTEGLLILTNDGDAANRLQHPRYGIEREYEVAVEQEVSEMVLERLRAGVLAESSIGDVDHGVSVRGRRTGLPAELAAAGEGHGGQELRLGPDCSAHPVREVSPKEIKGRDATALHAVRATVTWC